MSKGGADIYQSPYQEPVDTLGYETALSILSGQGINPSPTLASAQVAQQLGGTLNRDGSIAMPDGSVIQYDPINQSFQSMAGGGNEGDYSSYYRNAGSDFNGYKGSAQAPQGFDSYQELQNYVSGGGQVYDSSGKAVTVPVGATGDYLDRANQIYGEYQSSAGSNPINDMFTSYQKQTYNPTTGQYEAASLSDVQPQSMGADYYLGKYGDFLNKPTQSLAPLNDSVRASIYQKGADRIASSFRDAQAENEKFVSRQGGGLSSGRLAGLKRETSMEKDRQLQDLGQTTDTEAKLRDYEDAKTTRAMDRENQMTKLATAESTDAAQKDRAFGELQADRQQKLSAQQALTDLMRIYAGQDATASQYAAAKANAVGSAFGGIMKGVGGAFGGG